MDKNLWLSLGIKDEKFHHAIEKAHHATEKLNEKLEHINEIGKELFTVMAGGFALFKGFEFIKEAYDEVVKVAQVQASINNLLKNQGTYTDEITDKLKEQREEYEKIGITAEKTALAQRAFYQKFEGANFAFEEMAVNTAVNMSAVTGASQEASMDKITLAIGKGLNGPISQRAAKSMGLNYNEIGELNKTLTKWKENDTLGTKDHRNEIAVMITEALEKHYKAEYKTMHDLDPFAKFKDALVMLTPKVGELAGVFATKLAPDLLRFVDYLKDLIDNHLEGLKHTIGTIYEGLKEIAEYFALKTAITSIKKGFEFLTSIFGGEHGASGLLKNMVVNATTVIVNGAIGSAATTTESIVASEVGAQATAGELGAAGVAGIAGTVGTLMLLSSLLKSGRSDNYTNNNGETTKEQNERWEAIIKEDKEKNNYIKEETNTDILENTLDDLIKMGGIIGDWPLEMFKIIEDEKAKKAKAGLKETPDPGMKKGGETGTSVTGQQPKQIIININDGLINNMRNTFNSVKEGVEDIERTITQAIIN